MAQDTTQISIPANLYHELEVLARKHGMDVPAYIAFITRIQLHDHDRAFVNATRFVFAKYSETLRKLAE